MIPVQQPAPLGGGSPLVERCSGHRGASARLLEWEGASSSGAYGRWGATLTVLALAGAWNDPGNWARDEKWEWNGKPVGRMLRKGFAEQRPLLAVDAAGALPFFSELPALDMLGLNDRYLARHRPADFGKGAIGHELGDADYYLARKPDLFCFGTPPCHFHAKFSEQRRMVRTREFRDAYVPTRFVSRRGKRRLVSELWLRLDGRIGLRVSDDRIDVPAYLLTGRAQGVEAFLSRSGAFVTRWKPGRSSTLRLAVPPGNWNLIVAGARGAAPQPTNDAAQ